MVLNPEKFTETAARLGLDLSDRETLRNERLLEEVLERIRHQTTAFPGYAQINRVAILDEPLTPENGLLTPTLKLRRNRVLTACSKEVESLYAGH